jgi:two-component sensor histidine kinase
VGASIRPAGRLNGWMSAPFAAIWLAIVMLIGIAVLGGMMIWQTYNSAIDLSEARAKASAQVVAAHIEWMMEASDQALRRIDAAVGDAPIRNSAGTIANIRDAVADLPEDFQYSVYDETGRLRFSSVPEAIGIDVSDREYFRKLRDGDWMVISPQLEERLSGEQVFVVAQRIAREDGFRGAASIAIPTGAMDEFWSLMELGPDSTVTVVRTDGWLVARHPQLPHAIDFNTSPLFTEFLPGQTSGFYHSEGASTDGIPRIIGFRKVDNWPLVATAGIAWSEALQFFWVSLRSGLAIGLPMVGLLVLGIGWIVHLLREHAERNLELQQALERNEFLLREIHHRVKNNLQAVSSLVRLQPLPQETKDDLGRRIAAMIAVHEQIYRGDQFDRIELAPYAERLVKEVTAGFPGKVTLDTSFEPVTIGRDQALPVGLILNELISNSYKHAFRDRDGGTLRVALTCEGENVKLVVEDDGGGYEPQEVSGGMGRRLIEGFVGQLNGTLEVDTTNGTRSVLTFPVA